MLSAPKPHLLGFRNAGAELVRLSQAKQILAIASQIHSTHSSTSLNSSFEIEGKSYLEYELLIKNRWVLEKFKIMLVFFLCSNLV